MEAAGEGEQIGGLGGVARAGEYDSIIAQSKDASEDDASRNGARQIRFSYEE